MSTVKRPVPFVLYRFARTIQSLFLDASAAAAALTVVENQKDG